MLALLRELSDDAGVDQLLDAENIGVADLLADCLPPRPPLEPLVVDADIDAALMLWADAAHTSFDVWLWYVEATPNQSIGDGGRLSLVVTSAHAVTFVNWESTRHL